MRITPKPTTPLIARSVRCCSKTAPIRAGRRLAGNVAASPKSTGRARKARRIDKLDPLPPVSVVTTVATLGPAASARPASTTPVGRLTLCGAFRLGGLWKMRAKPCLARCLARRLGGGGATVAWTGGSGGEATYVVVGCTGAGGGGVTGAGGGGGFGVAARRPERTFGLGLGLVTGGGSGVGKVVVARADVAAPARLRDIPGAWAAAKPARPRTTSTPTARMDQPRRMPLPLRPRRSFKLP